MRFADLTTLRVGGPIGELVTAESKNDLIAAIRQADASGTPLLVVGGGSNLLVSDDGFGGRVIRVATSGIRFTDQDDHVLVSAAAGENWDRLVVRTIDEGLRGFECLSGIPGSTGATPVQNVGAYGEEIAQTVVSVEVFDRQRDEVITFTNADCNFVYRSSVFKRNPRYVILEVAFRLVADTNSVPINYIELARTLGVVVGETMPLVDTREAVLGLRRGKGMVLDSNDSDTFSVGSFFTNPIIDAGELPESAPHWPAGGGRAKVSAAWLIGQAGFERGHRHGNIGISTKHTLAIANVNGGTAAEVVALASEIGNAVRAKFGIELHPEPVFIGFDELDS